MLSAYHLLVISKASDQIELIETALHPISANTYSSCNGSIHKILTLDYIIAVIL